MKPAIFFSAILTVARQNGWTYAQAVDYIADLGIGAVQFASSVLDSPEFDEYKRELDRRGIRCCCVHFGPRLGAADDAIFAQAVVASMKLVDKAAAIGAEHVMLLPVQLEDVIDDPVDRQRALERSAEGLRFVAAYARTKHTKIVIENISRIIRPFCTADDLKYLAENVPYLTLNFDTGNFYCADQDGIEAYEILKKHFSLVHTKDWAIASEGGFVKTDGTHLVDCIHGTGVVPIEDMMKLLKRDNFSGWAVIEAGGENICAKIEGDVAMIKKYS